MIDMEPEEMPEIVEERRSSQLGIIALVMSILCFSLSAITPWAMDVFAPVNDVAAEGSVVDVDFWTGILSSGFAPDLSAPHSKMHSVWTLIVMLGSIVALCVGVVAFVKREDTRISGLAMSFAFLSIFMQYMMVFAGVVVILIMLYLVLASFGVA